MVNLETAKGASLQQAQKYAQQIMRTRATRPFPEISDPMSVPYTFVDTTDGWAELGEELSSNLWDDVSIDTETEVIPGTTLDKDGPGPWAVTSVAAVKYDFDLDGKARRTEKVWVVDMTNIDTKTTRASWEKVVAYSWNAEFERKVFERGFVIIKTWIDLMLWKADIDLGACFDGHPFYTGLAKASKLYLRSSSFPYGVDIQGKGGIQLSFKPGTLLTDTQKSYAAQDAIVALWLVQFLAEKIVEAGIEFTVELDCAAQPFVQDMTRNGLPLQKTAWLNYVASRKSLRDKVAVRIAALTGGGTEDIFTGLTMPDWNISSPKDLRRILNEFEKERVMEYTKTKDASARRFGPKIPSDGRLIKDSDSLDDRALGILGGPIAAAVLEWRNHEKVVSTYGESLLDNLHSDGRFHPRYNQSIPATGRLSSDKPNAQNLSPEMKKFMTAGDGRVFIAGDASQAELRQLAQISKDQALLDAFNAGRDMHVVTAERMFKVDMTALKNEDQTSFKLYRQRGKTMNFAVIYGLGAKALGETLTTAGVPTDTDEARNLLRLYLEAYPGVAAWLDSRKQVTDDLAANPPEIDWALTTKLHQNFSLIKKATAAFKKRNGNLPNEIEIAKELFGGAKLEVAGTQIPVVTSSDDLLRVAQIEEQVRTIGWVSKYTVPTLLLKNGQPFSFESRTPSGRRRLFQVKTEEWMTAVAFAIGKSKDPLVKSIRVQWGIDTGNLMHKKVYAPAFASAKKSATATDIHTVVELAKSFEITAVLHDSSSMEIVVKTKSEDKTFHASYTAESKSNLSVLNSLKITDAPASISPLTWEELSQTLVPKVRADLVNYTLPKVSAEMAKALAVAALSERIRSVGNAAVNAPIQGGVSDCVLYAYHLLSKRLKNRPSVKAVQSVHDSIVLECDLSDAIEIKTLLKQSMEEALAFFMPDVPVKADVDVQLNLDSESTLTDEQVRDALGI